MEGFFDFLEAAGGCWWPLAIILIALVFRRSIEALVQHISEIDIRGVKVQLRVRSEESSFELLAKGAVANLLSPNARTGEMPDSALSEEGKIRALVLFLDSVVDQAIEDMHMVPDDFEKNVSVYSELLEEFMPMGTVSIPAVFRRKKRIVFVVLGMITDDPLSHVSLGSLAAAYLAFARLILAESKNWEVAIACLQAGAAENLTTTIHFVSDAYSPAIAEGRLRLVPIRIDRPEVIEAMHAAIRRAKGEAA